MLIVLHFILKAFVEMHKFLSFPFWQMLLLHLGLNVMLLVQKISILTARLILQLLRQNYDVLEN